MDLRLGPIPVRVQGWFVLMTLMLGMNERQPVRLATWVVVVTVSVVIHELGHALVGRAFGLTPSIVLHGMGGTTSFQGDVKLNTAKNVAISLAGPFAGFLFAVVIIGLQIAGFHPNHPIAIHALSLLFAVNIGWGIFNLVPMLPLDGGNVLRSLLIGVSKERGDKIARVVSVAIAGCLALYAMTRQHWWMLYLGVLFAFRNIQALRQADQLRTDQALVDAIESSYRALDRNEPKQAIALLQPALSMNATPDLRQVGVRIFVVAMLKESMWTEALATIEKERALIPADDMTQYARLLREASRPDDAARVEELGKAPIAPLADFRS